MKCPKEIKTLADVKRFIAWCREKKGLVFHPDSSFSEYVSRETGERIFTDEEAAALDALLDAAFEVCERECQDIYDYSMQVINLIEIAAGREPIYAEEEEWYNVA